MKIGEAVVGMKRRGSQLGFVRECLQDVEQDMDVPSQTEHYVVEMRDVVM